MLEENLNIDIDQMLNDNSKEVLTATKNEAFAENNSATVKNETKPEFEESLKELDKIVEELQRSDLALDRSMYLFRRGTELVQICREQLNDAEHEVKELLADGSEVDYVPEN